MDSSPTFSTSHQSISNSSISTIENILIVRNIQGNLSRLNELISPSTRAIISLGTFGLYNELSAENLSWSLLKQICTQRSTHAHIDLQDEQASRAIIKECPELLSDLPNFASGNLRFHLPIYMVPGPKDDPSVVGDVLSGEIHLPNLYILDHKHTYTLKFGTSSYLRLFGLPGSGLSAERLFDCGSSRNGAVAVAGDSEGCWSTIPMIGDLLSLSSGLKKREGESRILVHDSVLLRDDPALLCLGMELQASMVISSSPGPSSSIIPLSSFPLPSTPSSSISDYQNKLSCIWDQVYFACHDEFSKDPSATKRTKDAIKVLTKIKYNDLSSSMMVMSIPSFSVTSKATNVVISSDPEGFQFSIRTLVPFVGDNAIDTSFVHGESRMMRAMKDAKKAQFERVKRENALFKETFGDAAGAGVSGANGTGEEDKKVKSKIQNFDRVLDLSSSSSAPSTQHSKKKSHIRGHRDKKSPPSTEVREEELSKVNSDDLSFGTAVPAKVVPADVVPAKVFPADVEVIKPTVKDELKSESNTETMNEARSSCFFIDTKPKTIKGMKPEIKVVEKKQSSREATNVSWDQFVEEEEKAVVADVSAAVADVTEVKKLAKVETPKIESKVKRAEEETKNVAPVIEKQQQKLSVQNDKKEIQKQTTSTLREATNVSWDQFVEGEEMMKVEEKKGKEVEKDNGVPVESRKEPQMGDSYKKWFLYSVIISDLKDGMTLEMIDTEMVIDFDVLSIEEIPPNSAAILLSSVKEAQRCLDHLTSKGINVRRHES